MKPKISIIVPIYNVEEYLSVCLDSLCNQTYSNIEILCVNDGSIDDSERILESYVAKDKRIKFFTQKNAGLATARNVGLENATGKYIMFCDSDDYYQPNMCEEMINCIQSNDVDLVICACDFVIDVENNKRSLEYFHLKYFGKWPLTDIIKATTNVVVWNKIFKLDIIQKYHIKFPDGCYPAEDTAFTYSYLSVSKSIFSLNKQLYNYRIRKNSIMEKIYFQKQNKQLFSYIDVFVFVINFLKRNNLFEENKWILKMFDDNIRYVSKLLSEEDYKRYLKLLKKKVLSHYKSSDLINYQSFSEKTKRRLWGLVKEVIVQNEKEYFFCKIPIFKKIHLTTRRKYYLFGIQFYHKKIKNK